MLAITQQGITIMEPGKAERKELTHEEWKEEARRLLDIWASVKHARLHGVKTEPTLDAIFERPVPELPQFFDARTSRWISGWHSKFSSSTGEMYIPTSTDKPLTYQKIITLAIDKAFQQADDEIYYEVLLLKRFPRSGPYEVRPDCRRHYEVCERKALHVLRKAILRGRGK